MVAIPHTGGSDQTTVGKSNIAMNAQALNPLNYDYPQLHLLSKRCEYYNTHKQWSRRSNVQINFACTLWLLWLAVEWPWSALAGPFPTLLAQTGVETTPLPLVGTPFLVL